MLGLGLSLTTGGVISSPAAILVAAFKSRVIADGGTVESPSCAKSDVKFLLDNPPPSVFDADYQAILDRSTTLGYTAPSASQQTLQNTLVTDLKTAGVWDKLDLFYCFATDGDSDYATLNWKSPSSFQVTKVNSPTFTADEGFNGDGASAYLNTNWNGYWNGVKFIPNDASAGVWIHTIATGNAMAYFGDNGTGTDMRQGSNDFLQGLDARASSNTNNSLAYLTNDNSGGVVQIENTTDVASSSPSFGFLTSDTMNILAENGPFVPSDGKVSMFFIGGKIYSEKTDFYNAISNYISAL